MEITEKALPVKDDPVIPWQNKLLPWFIAMPTLLIIVFIVLATQQMVKFNRLLENDTSKTITEAIDEKTAGQLKANLDYIKWITLARMEEQSYNKRYSQAGYLIMSRIFTKYLGFFTGMILAIVGSVFIIGKIREDVTNLEGSIAQQTRFKVASSSPGIIFGVLGTILMLSAILQHTEISVRDAPLYINSAAGFSPGQSSTIDKIDADEINLMFSDTTSQP